MQVCKGLIAPDPNLRFPTAEEADLREQGGAAAFHRQLVLGNLASEYQIDIRTWLEALRTIESDEKDTADQTTGELSDSDAIFRFPSVDDSRGMDGSPEDPPTTNSI
jgi:hypothetical protein